MAAADKLTKLKHLKSLAEKIQTDYATKAELPTKVSDLTNDSDFQTGTEVSEAISAAVAGALIPSGSIAFASLPALQKSNCNKIYNITDSFTTTSDFVEGADKSYPAGTNVAIINVGTASSPSYKYDTYTGTFDFSGFATKVSSATNGNFAGLDSNGNITDSGSKASDFLTSHQDISGKADKVTGATNGNLAGLDSNGNLTDSGSKASDFLTAHQDISGKTDLGVIADIYSASAAYAVGDLVIYNGALYRCKTAIASPGEAWTAAHWDATEVADELASRTVSVATEGAGTISIGGTTKTIIEIATDAEVEAMIEDVFGTDDENDGE